TQTVTNAGTICTFRVDNVVNPGFSLNSGPFGLNTKTNAGVLIDASGIIGTVFVPPGTLGTPTVTPASLSGGAKGNVAVSFTTQHAWPVGGTLTVVFPGSYGFNAGGTTAVTGLLPANGTLAVTSIVGQTVTLTRSGGTPIAASTAVSFNLTNVQ